MGPKCRSHRLSRVSSILYYTARKLTGKKAEVSGRQANKSKETGKVQKTQRAQENGQKRRHTKELAKKEGLPWALTHRESYVLGRKTKGGSVKAGNKFQTITPKVTS